MMSERSSRGRRPRGWLALGLGLAGMAALIGLLHEVSWRLPGAAGAIYRHNVAADIQATALLYTESGSVRDYLDPGAGKYAFSDDRHR